jgi:hypothetical protein
LILTIFVTFEKKQIFMGRIKANKKTLIRWKIYIDRAKMYIGYVQFLMIAFVFLKSYKESSFGHLIFDNLLISVPIIIGLFVILLLVVGRIDTLLGFREEEMRNSAQTNPVTREILQNLKEIKQELADLKDENSHFKQQ